MFIIVSLLKFHAITTYWFLTLNIVIYISANKVYVMLCYVWKIIIRMDTWVPINRFHNIMLFLIRQCVWANCLIMCLKVFSVVLFEHMLYPPSMVMTFRIVSLQMCHNIGVFIVQNHAARLNAFIKKHHHSEASFISLDSDILLNWEFVLKRSNWIILSYNYNY